MSQPRHVIIHCTPELAKNTDIPELLDLGIHPGNTLAVRIFLSEIRVKPGVSRFLFSALNIVYYALNFLVLRMSSTVTCKYFGLGWSVGLGRSILRERADPLWKSRSTRYPPVILNFSRYPPL
jgi:hypothetical protein